MSEAVRLQRYLAAGGVAARRKAEQLITGGRVKVNGKVVSELGTKILPDEDRVEVDGEAVVALDKFYVILNKPKACITAVTDDRGRPTVMDYLPNLPIPVKPVGRLDFYTEGVLFLTNDGELAARLLAPGRHIPKTYHVKVHGELTHDALDRLRAGVRLDDGTLTMPAEVAPLPGESKHTWLAITIHEGKHRQIHRMIEALGHTVDKLQRVAFANLSYHNLRIGDARELDQHELNQLRDSVGLDHSTSARGRWHTRREDTDIPRRARAKARTEAEEAAEINETNRAVNAAAAHASDGERAGAPRDTPRRDDRAPQRGRDDRAPQRGRDDRRGPPSRDDRRGPPSRDDRRGPPSRDARRGPPSRDDRRPAPSAPRGGQGRTFGKRDQRERPASGAGASGDRLVRAYERPGAPRADRPARNDRPASSRSAAPRSGASSSRPPARSGSRPPSRGGSRPANPRSGSRPPSRGSRR